MKTTILTLITLCATLAVSSSLPAAGPSTTSIYARDAADEVDTPDVDMAAQHAEALADSDEDYDTRPDGISDAEYQADLDAKDAEDDTVPAEKRGEPVYCGGKRCKARWGSKRSVTPVYCGKTATAADYKRCKARWGI